jgi:hypothetical protein
MIPLYLLVDERKLRVRVREFQTSVFLLDHSFVGKADPGG